MPAIRRSACAALCLVAPVLLAGCGDGGSGGEAMEEGARLAQAPAPPPAPAMAEDRITVTGSRIAGRADGFQANSPAVDADAAPQDAPEGMMLAYSYRVSFELPAGNVPELKAQHEAECLAAGPSRCLILGGSVSGDGRDRAYGELSIRAEPGWLETFRGGLAEDADEAGGRIAQSSVSTEDLTRNIVDTQARLEAQETLRERLIALLERPSDEIDDLLAVERELARVQAQIDSARSQLAVMRARVDMSRLDLNYATLPRAVSASAVNPVVVALRDFITTLSASLGFVITLIAAAIPFVVILVPLAIWVWRLFRRRRRKQAGA